MRAKGHLFKKYMLSYLLIVAIPLIVLGGVLYQKTVFDLKKEIDSTSLHQLSQVAESVEAQFANMDFIATRISRDSELTHYMATSDEINVIQAQKALRRYCDFNLFEDLLLYFPGEENVLNVYGISSLKAACMAPHFNNWTRKDLKNAFDKQSASHIAYIAPDSPFLFYFCSLRNETGREYGKLGFVIRKNILLDAIDSLTQGDISSFFIKDGENIIYNDNALALSDETIENTLSSKNGITKTGYFAEQQIVLRCSSPLFNWNYCQVIDSGKLYKELTQNGILALLLYIVTFAIAVLLALNFSKLNYAPIKKLSDLAAEKLGNSSASIGGDELSRIAGAMENAAVKVQELKLQLELQETTENEAEQFSDWIKGRISFRKDDDYQKFLEHLNLDKTLQNYSVLLVSFFEKPTITRETMLFFLNDLMATPENSICFVDMTPDNQIAVLVGSNLKTSEYREEIARQLINLLEKKIGSRISVSIGTNFNCFLEIPHSYLEAVLALDYLDENSGQNVIFYESAIKDKKSDWWYPDDLLMQLNQYLIQGKKVKVHETLDALENIIYVRLYSANSRKCVLFEVYNFLIKFAIKRNVPIFFNEIDLLVMFEDREHFNENAHHFTDKILEEFSLAQNREKEQLSSAILCYVDENFTDCNFSMDAIAIHFNISLSYLGKFFHEHTGNTFSEYITQKRLELCKQLLIHTNKPIKEIVSEIGYLDHSNFTRKFRTATLVTPIEYRKQFTE